ncbi:Aldehyde dehydrogenase N-terminal [Penicillium hordei]|uniref:aldehyde dehydrogenase (NAD(+)) n=1 Tax=Penicillium hordei TaxID=40994 RepID=A0AAD6GYI7_9EURO|nr:Aldehyde dehydrogenase N-terminal [Penicillium hordei]KAJ5593279.1 Aldehyde dehydrogenase N-terminal [Penicillium hordei]
MLRNRRLTGFSGAMAGNTMVVKSSDKVPLNMSYKSLLVYLDIVLYLIKCQSAEIASGKGRLTPGIINIISGHGQISGNILSHHMDSVATSNMKNVILELGGKSPAIIFSDSDIAKAVEETKDSVQWNSGQVCMANSRIYAHESIASTFIELFNKRFAAVVIGNPLLPDDPRATGR